LLNLDLVCNTIGDRGVYYLTQGLKENKVRFVKVFVYFNI